MAKGASWLFLESSQFQAARRAHLSDVEFEAIQELLPRHPDKWVALKGGPGLFGLHWGVKEPVTIVFAISPEAKKIFLLGIESGVHSSVTDDVKKALPGLLKQLEHLGVRVAVGYTLRQLIKWLMELWP